jgi:hypothetical protein
MLKPASTDSDEGKNDISSDTASKKAKIAPSAIDTTGSSEAQATSSHSQETHSNPQALTGWIWRISPPHGVTNQEIEDWMSEGTSLSSNFWHTELNNPR